MKLTKILALAAAGVVASATLASAHVWNIGWESSGGNLTFYGVSYHNESFGTSVDDFAANPAGFVINGTNLTFDIGSAVDLAGCNGPGGLVAGSCDSDWNALGLDGALESSNPGLTVYGKYATATILAADLGTYGISAGSNSVTLTTFANNVHWQGRPFDSANVPLDIVVSAVPVPAGLPLALAGFGLLGGLGLRKRAKKAA